MAISDLKKIWDRWRNAAGNQPALQQPEAPRTVSRAADQQTRDWDRWNEAQTRQESRKTVQELSDAAYRAYQQNQYATAAALFAEAAELARQQRDPAAQAENLCWEGAALQLDDRLREALARFLQAEQLNALDSIDQFRNLLGIVNVAIRLPLPLAEQQGLLAKLEPYKGNRQIGGSKSMILNAESDLLYRRGLDQETLAKDQEAFASRIHKAPMYTNHVYFERLVISYRLTEQYEEARQIQGQWKREASHDHASEKSRIKRAEAQILYAEGRREAAWDMMQQAYAEERYIGRAGKVSLTLFWLIRIGAELGYFDQILPFVRQMLSFRRSESLFRKHDCYLSVARYCCFFCIRGDLTPADSKRMHRHARFWLQQAEQTARTLDQLLETTKYTDEFHELRVKYREGCHGDP